MSEAIVTISYLVVSAGVGYLWMLYMGGFRYAEGDDYLFATMLGLLWPVSLFILAGAALLSMFSGDLR